MTTFNPYNLKSPGKTVAEYLVGDSGAPAALVSIADDTRMIRAASGVTDIATEAAARAGQTFEIGSQTKMMTAVVILQLVEEGQLDLNSRLADHLPTDLIAGIANATEATIGQALSMTTGIVSFTDTTRPDGTSFFDVLEDGFERVIGLEDALAHIDGLAARFRAGEGYEYSNTNYGLLGAVIEAVTRQPLSEIFEHRIFDPLGMKRTFLEDFRDDRARLSSYLPDDEDLIDVTGVLWDAGAEGGVISTTADMTRFMKALLVDQTLLSEEALAHMADFDAGRVDPQGFTFGNGLVRIDVEGIGTFVGFAGGTLGTDSASFLHLESGRILSTAVTATGLEQGADIGMILATALADDVPAWGEDFGEGPLHVKGVSAAECRLTDGPDGVHLVSKGASVAFETSADSLDSADIVFADGSIALVGGDGRDLLRLSGHFAGAANADNLLVGFAGNDRLVGANGDDRLQGKGGRDVLKGRGGDDKLIGGAGHDRLFGHAGDDRFVGGRGNDFLKGGRGEDVFVFRPGFGTDRVIDFDAGSDCLLFDSALWSEDLTALKVVDQFATIQSGKIVFDFGDSAVILGGTSDLASIADDLAIA